MCKKNYISNRSFPCSHFLNNLLCLGTLYFFPLVGENCNNGGSNSACSKCDLAFSNGHGLGNWEGSGLLGIGLWLNWFCFLLYFMSGCVRRFFVVLSVSQRIHGSHICVYELVSTSSLFECKTYSCSLYRWLILQYFSRGAALDNKINHVYCTVLVQQQNNKLFVWHVQKDLAS